MLELRQCIVCGTDIEAASTGRPRLYCSNRCRLRAQRERKAATSFDFSRCLPAQELDLGELEPSELLGPRSSDRDEAVVESIILARAAAAAFGIAAERARPQLAWRCLKMADHIAAGLARYFKP